MHVSDKDRAHVVIEDPRNLASMGVSQFRDIGEIVQDLNEARYSLECPQPKKYKAWVSAMANCLELICGFSKTECKWFQVFCQGIQSVGNLLFPSRLRLGPNGVNKLAERFRGVSDIL